MQTGLFCGAMMAMLQGLDAGGFFCCPQQSIGVFLALFLKVFWDGLSWHGCSVADPAARNLFHIGQLVRIYGKRKSMLEASAVHPQ